MKHLLTRAALLAALCSLAGAGTASAGYITEEPSCDDAIYLYDSSREQWQIDSRMGHVWDGSSDSYDDMGYAGIGDIDNDSWTSYEAADAQCGAGEDGQEVVFPFQPLSIENIDGDTVTVDMQRKVYVPSNGQAFARWLDVFMNTGTQPVTFDYWWDGRYGARPSGQIVSADGDDAITDGERWGAFEIHEGDDNVASLWDGKDGADSWDYAWDVPSHKSKYLGLGYRQVTIPAGGKAVYMHVEHQGTWGGGATRLRGYANPYFAEAVEFAQRNEAGGEELFARMTDDEKVALRNWNPDADRDGVLLRDNCESVVNPTQSDIDGDGIGDACDEDVDGDGLTNAQEQRLGTNPASADTDGDGNFDGVDRCPTRSGTADGCPAVAASQQSIVTPRLRAQRLTAELTRKRIGTGLRMTTSGELRLPKGVSKAVGCQGVVLVTTKAGKLTVSSRRVRLSSDCTYRSTVGFASRSRFGRRALTVQATFQGNARIFRQRAAKLEAGRA